MVGARTGALLNYNLFRPPGSAPGAVCTVFGTTPWNATGTGLVTLESSTARTARLYNVCGTIPGGQGVPVDTYSDTVGMTLDF
jgi:spore coat protein U-like protein